MKRNNLLTRLTAALALFVAPANPADAQSAPSAAYPGKPPGEEKAIELSPFTVTADQDVGYLAGNTLAGSRLNTPLKDTAASITVITREFLDDLAATDLSEALAFANNMQPNFEDEGTFGDNPALNSVMGGSQTYRVRGISAQLARNYFRWAAPTDTYNVGRVEDSRGPNSVLFGIGSAGGIINVATKQAELKRTIRAVSLAFDNNSSRRATLDYNQPLGDKAAIRVNALWNDQRSHLHHAFSESKRLHLAAKYRFTPKWQARIEFEEGIVEMNRGRNTGTFDSVVPWLQAGRPVFASTAPNATFSALGSRLAANQLRYISNSDRLINLAGQIATRGTVNFIPIVDTTIADDSINSGGPGQVREIPVNNYSAYVEGQLWAKTAIEVAYNHQAWEFESYDPTLSHNLYGDPNVALPGTLGANPNAGGLYMETAWRLNKGEEWDDTGRVALSSAVDAGKWGNYRLALLGEYEEKHKKGGNRFEIWEGSPFNTMNNPIAAANRVTRRTYVTEGDWSSYWVNGPRQTGLLQNITDPITGRTLSSTFRYPQSITDSLSKQWSGLLGLQARWFGGRLVAGAGYRHDRVSIIDRPQIRDAQGGFVIDYHSATEPVSAPGRTFTLGLVGHVNKHISLLYNRATNMDTPNVTLSVLPDLSLAKPPEGEGQDYGIAFDFPDQKLYLRAVRFTTAAKGQLSFGGTQHLNANNDILDGLMSANLIARSEYDRRYFFDRKGGFIAETRDREVEGYELSVTGNPTTNWRLMVNYSQTTGAEENILAEVLPWWAESRKFFETFPQDTPTGVGVTTIASEIREEDDYIANARSVEGVGIIGNRKHKASFFTRYTFDSGPLKGAYVGGGYRYQGEMLVGRAADSSLLYAPAYGEASFLAGYNVRLKDRRRLSLQLNVSNLFDETDPIVTRYATAGNLHAPRRMIIREPRMTRLTANFSF